MDPNDKRNQSGGMFGRTTDEFAVRSATSAVDWLYEDVPPAFPCYIGVDDSVLMQVASFTSNTPIVFTFRVLGTDGLIHPFQFTIPPQGNRAFQTLREQLMEGWILSASVLGGSIINPGQWAYAQVSLQRTPFGTNNQYQLLMAGYVDNTIPLSFPESGHQRTSDGAGFPLVFPFSAPAAGADIIITVPTGARWRPIAFRATLTTAAAVANRFVTFAYVSGATAYMQSPSGVTLAASSANTYNFFDSATLLTTPVNGVSVAPLPSNCYLQRGQIIQTSTANLQAADQWSAGDILVEEWFDNV